MALTAEQRRVLNVIHRVADRKGATPKERKAAIETGLVESGLRNLPGGDRDSAGWRQERASLYKDPTNLEASVERFFDETRAVRHKYSRAGDLAAAVQRPAAQYRGRYQAVSARAQSLMEGGGGSSGSTRTVTTTTGPPITPEGLTRPQLLQQYLATRGQPGGLLNLAGGLGSLKEQTSTKTITSPGDRLAVGEELASYVQRANTINAKQLPYQWGGGHGGKVNPRTTGPLDCSGAVSAVLGINPRVSGEFTKWGKPGEGNGRGVVVYANKDHVLMSIGGKFFGTSKSNPGGGAGWIPRSQISKAYLRNFTARHL
jgi:hypothetical protein